MSQTDATSTAPGAAPGHAGDEHGHDPYLAHHFDTHEQQFESSKLGMWVFLATEILMFGGLFCAYAIYRGNHQAIFDYGHVFLDTTLGGVNTLVLIASSFTMAWAVRASQLGKQRALLVLLSLTFLGGVGFMGIKAVEYGGKFSHQLWPGSANVFYPVGDSGRDNPLFDTQSERVDWLTSALKSHGSLESLYATMGGGFTPPDQPVEGKDDVEALLQGLSPDQAARLAQLAEISHLESLPQYGLAEHGKHHGGSQGDGATAHADASGSAKGSDEPTAAGDDATTTVVASKQPTSDPIPSGGTVMPSAEIGPDGVNAWVYEQGEHPAAKAGAPQALTYAALPEPEQERAHLFFQAYFMMTGLHGLHVLVGMGLIGYLIIKAAMGAYGPKYFTPVDIIGLYWHLVDLIWIFLFPLLYLIG